MNVSYNYCRIILTVICLGLTAPMLNAAPAAAAAAAAAESQEQLTQKLHQFGLNVAESYNRCVKGNKKNKEFTKNSDGSFTAVYYEIDPKSVTVSYRDSSNPKGPVRYIGTLNYAEVKYSCTGKTKAEAEKGPFTEQRSMTTELVKYVKGKWSY